MSTGKQEGAVESPMVTQDRLPFLPGYRIQTMPKEKYHKTHMFEVSNGVRCDVNRDGALLDQRSFPLSATHPLAVTKGASDRSVDMKASAESTMSRLPSWVAYDRKVLRFYGWFEEPVHSSPEETFRVRKCVFCYYLEDDSVHIGEPKVENSGIPQGVLIKRHRIPKADNSYIGIDDLSVGSDLTIYGRVYHITDCDEFTRTFYQNAGKPQGEAQDAPQDEFAKKKAKGQPKMTMYGQHKDYVEASLGKTVVNVPATKKFLANDGKVLRFYCQWDDKNMFGEKRPYILNYFLADDTCAVLEIPTPNSGRDNWSAMVKRARLPKDNLNNLDMSKIGQGVDKTVRYYTDADLRIGDTILVFGRPLFLCGCDQFTKEYYIANYGMTEEDFPRLNMEEEKITLSEIAPPPYNGFGNEEDSLGSYLHLMPKIPKPDFKKLMENEGKKMGFLAEWAEPPAGEKARRFVITFYLNNDQVAVFERPERNSGFHGGKFLERTRFKNPKTNLWYQPQDFQIGAEVTINTFRFRILAADDFTKQYMADHPDQFPQAKQAGAGATVSFDATATSPVNTQGRGPSPKNTSSITASVGAQIAGQGQGSGSPSARRAPTRK